MEFTLSIVSLSSVKTMFYPKPHHSSLYNLHWTRGFANFTINTVFNFVQFTFSVKILKGSEVEIKEKQTNICDLIANQRHRKSEKPRFYKCPNKISIQTKHFTSLLCYDITFNKRLKNNSRTTCFIIRTPLYL